MTAMTQNIISRKVRLVFIALVVLSGANASADDAARGLVGSYLFPDMPLKTLEPFIENDHGIQLGGVGSDLWHGPGDPPNRLWMLCDRGPNSEANVAGEKRRTFPVPDFTPLILQVEINDGKLKILKSIPIVDPGGKPIGGLPNLETADETPYDHDGGRRLPVNPGGIDPEAFVRLSSGNFWLAEEYRPSLVHCDSEGRVLRRYVPAGVKLDGCPYPVSDCLPAILARRKANRGFEGLTIGRDEKILYAVLQSPLENPSPRAANKSRNVRLLAFDIAQDRPVAEYLYRFEPAEMFASGGKTPKTSALKISGLAMLGDGTLLVLERTDAVAHLYKVNLAGATNLLGSRWDQPATSPTLEELDDPAAAGVTALSKSLAVDLSKFPNLPEKIEGIAVLDARTIAVANDNDFDLSGFDAAGKNIAAGVKTRVLVLRLDAPLF
jgi:hypothetical protein